MEVDEKIKEIEDFKYLLDDYFTSGDTQVRSTINQKKGWVRREVIEAGCFKTITVSPPPIVGGLVLKNVDLFEAIFAPPYGISVVSNVIDMLDETIGVLRSSDQSKVAPTKNTNDPVSTIEECYEKGYAFIVMSIDPSNPGLVDVLDSIKEAATSCGVHAERVDEVQTNTRITDRILESIQKAEFVIVDLTYKKPNVYYEAGYAQGLNKTPIYVAKEGTSLEFDLKDYPVIFFQNMRELKEGLKERLIALSTKA
jgi:hypothetical protein